MELRYDLVNNGIYNVYVISDDEYIGPAIAKGHEWDPEERPEAVFVYKTFI